MPSQIKCGDVPASPRASSKSEIERSLERVYSCEGSARKTCPYPGLSGVAIHTRIVCKTVYERHREVITGVLQRLVHGFLVALLPLLLLCLVEIVDNSIDILRLIFLRETSAPQAKHFATRAWDAVNARKGPRLYSIRQAHFVCVQWLYQTDMETVTVVRSDLRGVLRPAAGTICAPPVDRCLVTPFEIQ